MVNILKNWGSGHKTPTPIKEESPTAVAIAFFKVASQGSSFSTTTSYFFLGFLASNLGKGLGLGHNLFPLWVTIALPTTSSSKSYYKLFSLSTIDYKNFVILLAYKEDDYPDNLDGKSVYPIILTPYFSII